MNIFDITGHKVIVTGGTRGCGYAIAEGFLEANCEVVIIGSSDKAYSVPEAFRERGFPCRGVRADLSDADQVQGAFDQALELLAGRLDTLVNNAAVQFRCPADEVPLDRIQWIFRTNFIAPYLLTANATRVMKKQGRGRVINISSNLAVMGGIGVAPYSATKGAVLQMTKSFSNDCAGLGITYNCIAPGYMDTDMIAAITSDPVRSARILKRVPMGRFGQPGDMKGACLFLASDAAAYVSGVFLSVDGGYMARS